MPVDPLVEQIAAYVDEGPTASEEAKAVAWLALFDALGCAMASTQVAECMEMVGPIVPGLSADPACHVPGTDYRVDPLTAAFGIGCMIRWLDFSDTWVALETGHPSDQIGAILAVAEFESSRRRTRGLPPFTLNDVCAAMIRGYEIQGVLGLTNSLSQSFGYDHVAYVRVPSAAVTAKLLGGGFREICSAVSHAWCDGHPLRVYRQAPNASSRKSWAGPDASARGTQLAFWALRGMPACGTVLTDPQWGMEAVQFEGKALTLSRPLGSYVMANLLFKTYPGVVHAQTALEAAIELYPMVCTRIEEIERVEIWTYETAIRITSKCGPLNNVADRDHCIQYMVAVGLLKGDLVDSDFSDAAASDSRIDTLRSKMVVREDSRFTNGFQDPQVRSCANGVQITFRDGTTTPRVNVEQPLGHASRRVAGLPHLERKLLGSLALRLPAQKVDALMKIFRERGANSDLSVEEFLALLVP